MQKCIVATSSVFALMEQEPEVKDAPDAIKIDRSRGEVKFEDITFSYKDAKGKKAKKPAVKHINLTLEPGKFYALVGPSGAGKSTLFSLLLRYYDTDEGAVTLDGVDIRKLKQESLRNNIGVVSQDIFLFHDTIGENIRYGRLDATDEEIIAAAERSHAHEFITQNKLGYKSVVGDSGNNLSGGQKQRVSIARAILRNAPILLLDEATSALDTESERIIQDAIQALSEGKTVVAIAHRLSTILEADQIVVMEKGRILDVGPHGDLMQRCELYQRLYQLQFKNGDADPAVPMDDVVFMEPYETEAAEV
jgi:subfamily B ATP-binding cassette protein MsbA